ncbi:MAG: hypothetical protein KC434_21475, partial [Anaerolineales bacterium]|nr:hypothetical protein [Anaerolineales bacterium]
PSGQDIAFIFNDDLFIMNLEASVATQITADDLPASHPTWAPYGLGLRVGSTSSDDTPLNPAPTLEPTRQFVPTE